MWAQLVGGCRWVEGRNIWRWSYKLKQWSKKSNRNSKVKTEFFCGYSQIDVWQKSTTHLTKPAKWLESSLWTNGKMIFTWGRTLLDECVVVFSSREKKQSQEIHSELIYSAYLWSFRGEMRMDNWNIKYSWQHITGKMLNGSLGLIGTKKRFEHKWKINLYLHVSGSKPTFPKSIIYLNRRTERGRHWFIKLHLLLSEVSKE